MKLDYFIVADSLVLDQFTQRVSIFHIVDEIIAPAFPVVLPSLATVACLEGEPSDSARPHRAILRLAGSAAAEPYDLASEFALLGARHRLVHRVENVVLSAPGIMEFSLFISGELLAQRGITVLHK